MPVVDRIIGNHPNYRRWLGNFDGGDEVHLFAFLVDVISVDGAYLSAPTLAVTPVTAPLLALLLHTLKKRKILF